MNGMEDLCMDDGLRISETMKDSIIRSLTERIGVLQKEIRRLNALNAEAKSNAFEWQEKAERIGTELTKAYMGKFRDGWTAVAGELPPVGVLVWAQSKGGVQKAAFINSDGVWWTDDHKRMNVEYWQFLPLER